MLHSAGTPARGSPRGRTAAVSTGRRSSLSTDTDPHPRPAYDASTPGRPSFPEADHRPYAARPSPVDAASARPGRGRPQASPPPAPPARRSGFRHPKNRIVAILDRPKPDPLRLDRAMSPRFREPGFRPPKRRRRPGADDYHPTSAPFDRSSLLPDAFDLRHERLRPVAPAGDALAPRAVTNARHLRLPPCAAHEPRPLSAAWGRPCCPARGTPSNRTGSTTIERFARSRTAVSAVAQEGRQSAVRARTEISAPNAAAAPFRLAPSRAGRHRCRSPPRYRTPCSPPPHGPSRRSTRSGPATALVCPPTRRRRKPLDRRSGRRSRRRDLTISARFVTFSSSRLLASVPFLHPFSATPNPPHGGRFPSVGQRSNPAAPASRLGD